VTELIVYHDFVSPFSRVALVVARTVSGQANLELRTVPLELWPAPLPLPAPGEGLGEELRAALPLASQLDVAMALPPLVPRTRKAHEAVVHARAHGLELPMAEAVYDALWRRGLDIGRLDVLADLGAEVGLDRDLLHVALGLDAGEAEVVAGGWAAESAGIDGVPTFRLGEAVAIGLLPSAELLEWIRAHR
jgi:predicted DsbA family dithiol-disulfide isomerase